MARSRDFKQEYAKRVARARERGLSRQQGRGHSPGEAARRAEREREEYGITSNEVRSIRSWVDRLGNVNVDPDDVIERAMERGYDWFRNYRDTLNEARRNYRGQSRRGSYKTSGMGALEELADLADVDDVSWVYYH